jgi:type IV secretory pathway TraG/TraD family ATPase VirD4
MFGVLIFFLVLSQGLSGNKSKRTNAHLADKLTRLNLCRQAIKQLKLKDIESVCLYSGFFKEWQTNPLILWLYIYVLNREPALFVPTANPGIEVVGAPGMGKTFCAIDPLLISAIDQGFSIILYDYKGSQYGGKGGQMPYIGAYAARHKYKVKVFAPGKDYTCTLNPEDYIEDSSDRTMAETLAETLHENLRKTTGKTDNFFGPAGKRVLFSSFLLAKNTQYPDLVMAFAFLQLSELGKRLNYAREQNNPVLTVWNYVAFSQYMTFAQAGETSEGILGGAQDISSVFIQPDLMPCILGQSNVSLDLSEREILIFQSNESRRKVYNPLIAALIEITVNRNFSYQRKTPLVLSLDEYPTIKIKESVQWPNLHRSKGLVQIIGYQNEAQVIGEYDKESLNSVRTGLKCKFLFNPMNEDNEIKLSKSFGEKEVVIKNKSYSYNGGKSSRGTTISEQRVMTPLIRSDDIRGMPQGACIYTSPELKKRKRANIPWKIDKIKVSWFQKRTKKKCVELWFGKILPTLRRREQSRRGDNFNPDLELEKRLKLADELLPLPPKPDSEQKSDLDTIFN